MKTSIYDLLKLKKILAARGYSVPEFAIKIGQSKANVYSAMNRNRPNQDTISEWAAGLDMPATELDNLLKADTEITISMSAEGPLEYKGPDPATVTLRIELLEVKVDRLERLIIEKDRKTKG